MMRYEIVVHGVLDEHIAEILGVTISPVEPGGVASSATVLLAELADPEGLLCLMESFEDLGLGISGLRAMGEF